MWSMKWRNGLQINTNKTSLIDCEVYKKVYNVFLNGSESNKIGTYFYKNHLWGNGL